MKKISIVTITNGGLNFGNRLQNYALQTVLQRYHVHPETIFTANAVGRSLLLSKGRWILRSAVKRTRRQRYFDEFNKRHILAAPRIRYWSLNEDDFRSETDYAAFITGSDQVWNPEFWFNSDFEFLTFADPAKRYSYAASIGVGEIPPEHRATFAAHLGDMRAISVREERGAEIVAELTGRQAEVHVDPTLLLNAGQYAAVEQKPPQTLPDDYVLTYFLGEIPGEYRAFVNQIAESLRLPMVELNELSGSELFGIGPQHFLHLLRHARYICTDSFHGANFAILFHRPFTVFDRKGNDSAMGSRIDTLLQTVGLENRRFGKLDARESLDDIPFAAVEERIERERERSDRYFREISAQWDSPVRDGGSG